MQTPISSIALGRDMSSFSNLSVTLDSFSDDICIPRNCLEGIWKKACELLKTDDSIVSAPGVNQGKFVLSYSNSKPHLVVPSRSSIYSCDSECPNWKGLGICAHSVAVAEMNGKLPDYIEKVKKKKQTPNISKFAKSTMPKGRGRKGSQQPRKRKAYTSIETHLENPALATNTSDTTHLTPPQFQLPSPVNQPQPNYPMSPYCRSTQSPAYLTDSTSLTPSTPQFQLPSPVYQPQLNYPLSPYCRSTQPHAYPTDQFWHTTPFTLCKILGNISTCVGCRNKYTKTALPPDDVH